MDDIQFEQVKMGTQTSDPSEKIQSKDKATSNQGKHNVNSDIKIIRTQLDKLNKLKTGISNMLEKLAQSKQQSQTNRQTLAKQSTQLQTQITQYQTSLQKSSIKLIQAKIQSNKKSYISMWQNRIAIAETVNVKEFMDVELEDRKSLANELFKWIIVAIYGEAEAKFYWPNFKEQVFEKDQGKDFRERLGKINAANAKEEQVIKVKDFLEKYDQILASEQLENFTNVRKQAEKLRQVAELYLKCHDVAKNTVQLQAQITKDKQMSLQKDEQAMKWKGRHEALQQRIQVIDQYTKSLEQIENSLKQKVKTYQKREQLLNQFESKLRKGQYITSEQLNCLVNDAC